MDDDTLHSEEIRRGWISGEIVVGIHDIEAGSLTHNLSMLASKISDLTVLWLGCVTGVVLASICVIEVAQS